MNNLLIVNKVREILEIVIFAVVLFFYIIYCYSCSLWGLIFPKPLKSLVDEVILVTGSANGIGREVCIQLATSGAKLVCWDIRKEENEDLVKLLRKQGAVAYGYEIDVSKREQVKTVADKTRQEVGDVTILINNAGIAPCQKFLSTDPQIIQDVFNVNVISHFWTLGEFLPSMIEQNKGHIVTMCSIAGLKGNRYMVPYHGSKAAIHGYIQSLKEEIRHHPKKPNIKFTTVYPTGVKTRLMEEVNCVFRFPSQTPILEIEYVAKRLIDGIRREEETVYCPRRIQLFMFLEQFLPTLAQYAVTDYLMPIFQPVKNDIPEYLKRKQNVHQQHED